MLLLDQGLPLSAVAHLRTIGIDAVHASEIGLSTADDATILEYALGAGTHRSYAGCGFSHSAGACECNEAIRDTNSDRRIAGSRTGQASGEGLEQL